MMARRRSLAAFSLPTAWLGLCLASLLAGCFPNVSVDKIKCADTIGCPVGYACGLDGKCCKSSDGVSCNTRSTDAAADGLVFDSGDEHDIDAVIDVPLGMDTAIRDIPGTDMRVGSGGAPGTGGTMGTGIDGSVDQPIATGGIPATGGSLAGSDLPGVGGATSGGADAVVDRPISTGGIVGTGGILGSGGTSGTGGLSGGTSGTGGLSGGASGTGGLSGTGGSNPDAAPDLPHDLPSSPDLACAVNTPCTRPNGAKSFCSSGTCQACTDTQDDAVCATAYGSGTLCVDGQCVAGYCHNSEICVSGKVCDATHYCRDCASDDQCHSDSFYGTGTICISATGQCVSGRCHNSAECMDQGLCDAVAHTCSACTQDSQCQADTVYSSKHICVSGQCVDGSCTSSTSCVSSGRVCDFVGSKVCVPCTSDSQCRNDTAYSSGYVCTAGQCVPCSTSSRCYPGYLCNTTAHTCDSCTTDIQCRNDTAYGVGHICLSGSCVVGTCHDTSADCASDWICGASTPHTCGLCTSDTQCKNDQFYGINTICASTGRCVSSACPQQGTACSANTNDFCCNSKCVAGNCCVDADCAANPSFGSLYVCVSNSCVHP